MLCLYGDLVERTSHCHLDCMLQASQTGQERKTIPEEVHPDDEPLSKLGKAAAQKQSWNVNTTWSYIAKHVCAVLL